MIRLQKFLSELGHCSRREAELLIRGRKITVNGRIARLGDKVEGYETIVVAGKRLPKGALPEKKVIAYYKPKGVEPSLQQTPWQKTLKDIDFDGTRLFPIGKLDREANGLLLLTNDGELGNMLSRPGENCPEEYILQVKEILDDEKISLFGEGILQAGKQCCPHGLSRLGDHELRFVLRDGRGKLVRKLADQACLQVVELKRIRIGAIGLGDLAAGEWRELSSAEVTALREGKPVKTGRRKIVSRNVRRAG